MSLSLFFFLKKQSRPRVGSEISQVYSGMCEPVIKVTV